MERTFKIICLAATVTYLLISVTTRMGLTFIALRWRSLGHACLNWWRNRKAHEIGQTHKFSLIKLTFHTFMLHIKMTIIFLAMNSQNGIDKWE